MEQKISLSKKFLLVARAKVTLITTVKNEEKTIGLFLDSVKKQTRKPDEVIVVDGGSTDKTISKIQDLRSKIKVKVIRRRGNRSVGRNTAVKNSSNNIIACTDAGCILDPHWLERITLPFEKLETDVVSGFYKPITTSIFEKCLAAYTCTMPDRLDKKNFLPSSRSVAFRKSAWLKAEGYPEKLATCEDLIFDKRLKNIGARFVTEEKAIVYWPQRTNIFQAARQFFSYAVGDGKARYFRKSTPFLFGRYTLGGMFLGFALLSSNYYLLTIIFLLFGLYLLWAVWKNYRYVRNPRAFIYLPLLQLVSDICVMTGMLYGITASHDII